jgi:uncharacterized membrane protein YdjX (TVP38/TMEM64 family)
MSKFANLNIFKNLTAKEVWILVIFIAVFIAVSIFANRYSSVLQDLLSGRGAISMLGYVGLEIIATVIAPVSAFPLLPIVVVVWGSFLTAVLSIIGWQIGSLIAFGLARRYGKKFVAKVVDVKRIEEIAGVIPENRFFWLVVLLRFIFPVDILSFALGLFTQMRWLSYFTATLIGITPFAFIFAYGVRLPIIYQVILGVLVIFVTLFYYNKIRADFMKTLKEHKEGEK